MPQIQITLLGGFQARTAQGGLIALPARKIQALFILRRALQAVTSSALLADARSVSLDASAAEVDAIGFEQLVAAGTEDSEAVKKSWRPRRTGGTA